MSKTRQASKSNKRAKRQARAKATRESRREAVAVRAAERQLDELFGVDTPPQRSAELMIERLGGGAVPAGISRFFALAGSTERAHEVAGAVAELAPDSLCALTLGADVTAHLERDDRVASSLIDRALELTDEDADRVTIADHLVRLGRAAEALAIVEELHLDDPEDEDLNAIRAAALTLALERANAEPDELHVPESCPCWSGRPWTDCCRTAEAAALERFKERTALTGLQFAIERYVESEPRLRSAVADDVRRWLEAASGVGEQTADPRELRRMAAEHGWLIGAEDRDPEPGQRFDPDSPLSSFALHPSTPSRQATAARRWLEHHSYGLWQIREPVAEPGVWLTELVTGMTRYAAIPSTLLEHASRWSVLLGGLVCVDGTWRPGAGMILLRPREADEAADLVQELTYTVASHATGKQAPRRGGIDLGLGKPHGVLASITEPSSPEVARFVSMVIGSGMPQLLAFIAETRDAQPKLVNTDKHPLCLIKATVAVDDTSEVVARLAEHAEFDVDGETITWWGRELDALERETSLAELRAVLKERGEDLELTEPEGPRRWLRGSISIGADALEVEVNSRERLQRLLSLLDDAGNTPRLVKQLVIDPAEDMPLPRIGSVLPASSSEEARAAWQQHWPDQELPALGGMTPRRAARSVRRKPWLEALLRELEHDSDQLARHGRPAPDVDSLRADLAMPVAAFT